MNKLKIALLSFAAMIGIATVPVAVTLAAPCTGTPADCARQGVNDAGGKGQGSIDVKIKDIINIILYVLGAVAVIMIVIGGLRYVISGGESSHVKAAKDTILYAVVGLVVALLAYAIVNFVLDSFVSK